ncbi:MAG: 4Fe-4S binding protein [Desulfobulbaceae bacterium]|nr:4Fe-4S binding protein [Desulfobulbaceae bacterium]HIJ79211.1 4Fe-4S binding protein [Deltaproteobacteria bacterium]
MASQEIDEVDNSPRRGELKHLRFVMQAAFSLFCLYSGYCFYLFYAWASGASRFFVPRPPAVEAFLPISGLIGLKQLLLTGVYDEIHPAGLTIFISALLLALFFRKGFCGWICPVGFISNLIEKIGLQLKTIKRIPVFFDILLMSLKYFLLAFFAFVVLLEMDLQAIEEFSRSPYNLVVDARMLLFFIKPSTVTLWCLSFLVFVSFFSRNFWCRYLCPYGALLGLIALFSPVRVKRDREKCIGCQQCEKVCPGSIRVAAKDSINSPECLGCLECVAVCPVDDCLKVSAAGRQLPALLLPLGILALFFSLWAWAQLSGHWQSEVPLEVLQAYYRKIRM